MPEAVSFLGEEDFLHAMEGDCLAWRNECVTEGEFSSFDSTPLHYYYAIPATPKATVLLVHGMCEFFGKYHEYAWLLYRAGYAVFFLEQRGHGLSGGKLPPPDDDIVYIRDYETYVKDLYTFIDGIVNPKAGTLPRILLGHSMGGAVAARYAETYPDAAQALLLSSPMFKLRAADYPYPVVRILLFFARLSRQDKKFAPGERHFDGVDVFATSSALSRARYDYVFSQRKKTRAYQTNGSSLGWALASLTVIHRIMKDGSRIRIPVTLFSAGSDRLVAPEGYDAFAKAVPQVKRIHYEASGHEIFNADTAERQQYFADVLATLEQMTTPTQKAGAV